jgi:hypothetical protein
MPTISQLTAVTSVQNTDQVPVYSTDNGDARKASLATLKAFFTTDVNFTGGTFTGSTFINCNIGTPSTGNLINCFGLPIAGGGTGATTADGALTNFGGTVIGKGVFTAATYNDALTALGGSTVGRAVFVATDAAAARTAITAAKSGVNGDISEILGLTEPLSAPQGGTGVIAPGAAGNILTSDGLGGWVSSATAAAFVSAVRKTANYTAVIGDVLACDTTAGSFTITLPSLPVAGQRPITIFDAGTTVTANGFATYALTVARNGSTIHGLSEDLIISTKGVCVTLEYVDGTWRVRIG